MEISPVIYLDTSFIVEMYEQVTKQPVPVRITKSENVSAGLSAGFVSGGAATTETKEFPVNTREMYKRVKKAIEKFPAVDIRATENEELPECFWTEGVFGASASQTTRGNEILHRESYFRLYSDIKEHKRSLVLVTNDVYLATGYDQVQKHLAGSCQGFGIAVRGLFRFLAHDIMDAPICAPLVMYKKGNV